jgi:hypothetical protein
MLLIVLEKVVFIGCSSFHAWPWLTQHSGRGGQVAGVGARHELVFWLVGGKAV